MLAPFDACWPSPAGTWSVHVLHAEVADLGTTAGAPDAVDVVGQWSLLHDDHHGHEVSIVPGTPPTQEGDLPAVRDNIAFDSTRPLDEASFPHALVHDFDHDGQNEIWLNAYVSWYHEHPEGEGSLEVDHVNTIFTVKNDAIVELEAAERGREGEALVEVKDVDGDGTLDLLTEFPSFIGKGFALHVARGLPDGTFSHHDPRARAATADQCTPAPARPLAVSVLKAGKPRVQYGLTAQRALCARLRGDSPADIGAELTRETGADDRIGVQTLVESLEKVRTD
jgi:hypothetical protein